MDSSKFSFKFAISISLIVIPKSISLCCNAIFIYSLSLFYFLYAKLNPQLRLIKNILLSVSTIKENGDRITFYRQIFL